MNWLNVSLKWLVSTSAYIFGLFCHLLCLARSMSALLPLIRPDRKDVWYSISLYRRYYYIFYTLERYSRYRQIRSAQKRVLMLLLFASFLLTPTPPNTEVVLITYCWWQLHHKFCPESRYSIKDELSLFSNIENSDILLRPYSFPILHLAISLGAIFFSSRPSIFVRCKDNKLSYS